MADSIDKLPLGIYKSIMNKAIESLNRPILYIPDRQSLLPPMFNSTEMYSPINNTDYDYEMQKRRLETIKFNKQNRLRSQQTFLEDYIKSLKND